ncbi:hypothetical protein M513_11169 [Trichuris suis]|uniref:Uncharacterized protein n=1 Tax=Trichuris suis TaxID=68888 RepID=A0A085LSJ0_9BILA|nr:hypothetical protein M513_11169 [Trichuris suis]
MSADFSTLLILILCICEEDLRVVKLMSNALSTYIALVAAVLRWPIRHQPDCFSFPVELLLTNVYCRLDSRPAEQVRYHKGAVVSVAVGSSGQSIKDSQLSLSLLPRRHNT